MKVLIAKSETITASETRETDWIGGDGVIYLDGGAQNGASISVVVAVPVEETLVPNSGSIPIRVEGMDAISDTEQVFFSAPAGKMRISFVCPSPGDEVVVDAMWLLSIEKHAS